LKGVIKMRWVRLKDALPGVVLTEDLKDEQEGVVIFKKGKKLSNADIALLKSKWNVSWLPVETLDEIEEGNYNAVDATLSSAIELKRSIYIEKMRELPDYEVPTTISVEIIKKALDTVERIVEEIDERGAFNPQSVKRIVSEVVNEIQEKESSNIQPILLKLRDYSDYTYTHSINVAMLSLYLGINLDLNRENLISLATGAMLHDVGKCKIPKEILFSERKLTPKEFAIIKKHPIFGYEIARESSLNDRNAEEMILDHHERLDGSGYPRGKKGDEISFFTSIVSIADEYDAITTMRAYSNARNPYIAVSAIIEDAGLGKLNPDVANVLVKSMGIYPRGTVMYLSDGSKVVAIQQNPGMLVRPIVRVLESEKFEKGERLDLSKIDLIIESVIKKNETQ